MAQKLHDTYKYSYDNLKVLLGGWNTWKQENAKDAKAYPIDTGPGTRLGEASGTSGQPGGAATSAPQQPGTTGTSAPKP